MPNHGERRIRSTGGSSRPGSASSIKSLPADGMQGFGENAARRTMEMLPPEHDSVSALPVRRPRPQSAQYRSDVAAPSAMKAESTFTQEADPAISRPSMTSSTSGVQSEPMPSDQEDGGMFFTLVPGIESIIPQSPVPEQTRATTTSSESVVTEQIHATTTFSESGVSAEQPSQSSRLMHLKSPHGGLAQRNAPEDALVPKDESTALKLALDELDLSDDDLQMEEIEGSGHENEKEDEDTRNLSVNKDLRAGGEAQQQVHRIERVLESARGDRQTAVSELSKWLDALENARDNDGDALVDVLPEEFHKACALAEEGVQSTREAIAYETGVGAGGIRIGTQAEIFMQMANSLEDAWAAPNETQLEREERRAKLKAINKMMQLDRKLAASRKKEREVRKAGDSDDSSNTFITATSMPDSQAPPNDVAVPKFKAREYKPEAVPRTETVNRLVTLNNEQEARVQQLLENDELTSCAEYGAEEQTKMREIDAKLIEILPPDVAEELDSLKKAVKESAVFHNEGDKKRAESIANRELVWSREAREAHEQMQGLNDKLKQLYSGDQPMGDLEAQECGSRTAQRPGGTGHVRVASERDIREVLLDARREMAAAGSLSSTMSSGGTDSGVGAIAAMAQAAAQLNELLEARSRAAADALPPRRSVTHGDNTTCTSRPNPEEMGSDEAERQNTKVKPTTDPAQKAMQSTDSGIAQAGEAENYVPGPAGIMLEATACGTTKRTSASKENQELSSTATLHKTDSARSAPRSGSERRQRRSRKAARREEEPLPPTLALAHGGESTSQGRADKTQGVDKNSNNISRSNMASRERSDSAADAARNSRGKGWVQGVSDAGGLSIDCATK